MRTHIILALGLLLLSISSTAQESFSITHTEGVQMVGANAVTVLPENEPSTYNWCGLPAYWIGNDEHKNAYTFLFSKPVAGIIAHITAFDKGEQIKVTINGKEYMLNDANLHPYQTDCPTANNIIAMDGKLNFDNGNHKGHASALLKLYPDEPIYSIKLEHINGLSSGILFDLSFTYTGENSNSSNDNNTTGLGKKFAASGLSISPNPNSGTFLLKGALPNANNATIEVINAVGQVVYHKKVTTKNGSINHTVNLTSTLTSGVYLIRVSNAEETNTLRFVLNK